MPQGRLSRFGFGDDPPGAPSFRAAVGALSRDTIERAMRTLTRYELGATVIEEQRT
jgi:hypothetical protein